MPTPIKNKNISIEEITKAVIAKVFSLYFVRCIIDKTKVEKIEIVNIQCNRIGVALSTEHKKILNIIYVIINQKDSLSHFQIPLYYCFCFFIFVFFF